MTMTIDDIQSRIVSIGAPVDTAQTAQRAAVAQASSRCEVAMDAIRAKYGRDAVTVAALAPEPEAEQDGDVPF